MPTSRSPTVCVQGGMSPIRWFRIRPAQIENEYRELFEERGVDTMRAYIGLSYSIRKPDGTLITERDVRPRLLPWLLEQYDKAERKETWSLTMEFAIVVLVAVELLFSTINFWHARQSPTGDATYYELQTE
jgi:hypothetical protein